MTSITGPSSAVPVNHDACAGSDHRKVSGWGHIGVACDEGLLVIGVAESDLAASHIAEVHAAAAILRQAAEVRPRIEILFVDLEGDRVLAELGVPALHDLEIDANGSC